MSNFTFTSTTDATGKVTVVAIPEATPTVVQRFVNSIGFGAAGHAATGGDALVEKAICAVAGALGMNKYLTGAWLPSFKK